MEINELNILDSNMQFTLKKTIEKIIVFKTNPIQYALFIHETDRSILLSEEEIDKIIYISDLTNGNRYFNEINEIYSLSFHSDDLMKMLIIMNKLHLFDDELESKQFKEMSLFSKQLFKINCKVNNKFGYVFSYFYWGVLISAIILFLIFVITKHKNMGSIILNLWEHRNVANYILSIVFMIPFCILHEFSHVLVASKYKRINKIFIYGVLYFYFIPYFYVKICKINTLERCQRIKILCAGIVCNLLFGILLFFISILTDNYLIFSLSISNFRLVLINLLPMGLTDGYFILCNLTQKVNLRKKYYEFIANIGVKKKHLINKMTIYFVITFFYFILYIFIEMYSIITLFKIKNLYCIIISVCMAILFIIYYIIFIKWRVHNMRKNNY